MNPLRLQAQGYRSFANLDLELPEGVIAIVGPNGAGKSSIVNAIELALFGGRLADHLNDAGADDLMVELTFEHGGETYRVRRSYSAKGRGKTVVDFEEWDDLKLREWIPLTRESAKATQVELERIIGFTRDTWRASSFLAQGDGAAFCDADPRDRKRILSEAVLGRDPVWPRLLAAVRADRTVAQTRIAELGGALERAEQDVERIPTVERDVALLTEAVIAATAEHDRAERELAAVAERYRQAEGQVAARKTAEAKLAEAQARTVAVTSTETFAAEAKVGLSHLDALIVDLEVRVARGHELADEILKAGSARSEWQQRKTERDHLGAEGQRIATLVGELRGKAAHVEEHIGESQACDRCGQTLGEEAARRAAESFRAEATELAAKAEEILGRAHAITVGDEPAAPPAMLDDIRNAPAELGAARERKAALEARVAAAQEPDFLRQAQEARSALAEAETALAALPAVAVLDIAAIQADGLTARAALTAARAALDEQQALKTAAETELARLRTLAAQTHTDRTERDRLLADVDQLAILERAYSPNGIPMLLIENAAIPGIEAEANRILADLGGVATRVELRTQRELKSGDGLADTLDVIVYTENGARDYTTLSGGERSRVNVALRVALARLLASRRGAESDLLVIDEPDGLDADGFSRLVDVLRGLAGDFSRIYVVSHHPDLRDAFEQTIDVEKTDGVSRVIGAAAPEAVPA